MKTGDVCRRDVVTTVGRASLTEIMSRDIVTAAAEDDAAWTLKTMRERGIRRVPVLDKEGELAGIVALDDLLEGASVALSDAVQAIGAGRTREGRQRKAPA